MGVVPVYLLVKHLTGEGSPAGNEQGVALRRVESAGVVPEQVRCAVTLNASTVEHLGVLVEQGFASLQEARAEAPSRGTDTQEGADQRRREGLVFPRTVHDLG